MGFIAPAEARSWVEIPADSHFPIQNIPLGLLEASPDDFPHTAAAIGEWVLDLAVLDAAGLLPPGIYEIDASYLAQESGAEGASRVREALFELLLEDNPTLRDDDALRRRAMIPMDAARLLVPCEIGAFVDFYSGINHASNVGRMFRPDQPPLLPNYRHLPVGYNGRASSVVVSGTPVRRPRGQQKVAESVVFEPTRELDFELEMGFFIATGNELGEPIHMERCEEHMLGFVLVNDWSARDVQRWEYQPLGPFLAKSFATSISPWIVTMDALEPFRVQGQPQDPTPLPHLAQQGPGHFNIELEVLFKSAKMSRPQTICRTNFRELYWSPAQQLAHQTSNGTNVQPGDLYASGTISGTAPDSFGSLLELTWRGERPIRLEETGEERRFLEDGDELTITGWCQGDGYRVGFGEVSGTVLPAR